MIADLIAQLRRDEGVRYQPYQDTLGNWTVGVGHKMLATEHYFYPLGDVDVNRILQLDIADKQTQLSAYQWFKNLDECRQGAITNMCFNLGIGGLLHFPSMIHYLSLCDWPEAAGEALNSLWAKQVGDRATRLAKQIQTGEWQ